MNFGFVSQIIFSELLLQPVFLFTDQSFENDICSERNGDQYPGSEKHQNPRDDEDDER